MFQGFSDSESFTPVPDSFFRQLMYEIEDVDELKVTLYAIWCTRHTEGNVHYLRESDFTGCTLHLHPGLEKAVSRGTLLWVQKDDESLYFLNSPRGRAAAEAYRLGEWEPGKVPSAPPPERPNIFKLYEENIGPLTPMIAEALKDAELTHPPERVVEALEIAVKSNKRSWKYVEAILARWKEEGYAKKQDRRDSKEIRGRDVTRKVEDFLKK